MTLLVKYPRNVAADSAPAGRTNSPAFAIYGYQVEGNTVLSDDRLDELFRKYTGPTVDLEHIRAALADLQLTYRNFGFATVGVSLPSQRLTNGVVRVQVTEGRLSDIIVKGNRYFSSNNVLRALPSLTTNVLLNTKWLQPELDRANANSDRQIYPVIAPGLEPGTTELTLQVKDRLPLHGHLELNDKYTPGTPLLRLDAAVQYNNLWQYDHQFGLEYNFSPQSMKIDSAAPFYDQPEVASYSTFYRIPLGAGPGLREIYDQMPVDFGYDQVTHRFNLPPATGNPDLIFYASRSTSDTGIRFGPVTTITDTTNLGVFSQTAERDPTVTENLGAKFIIPLPEWEGVRSSFSAGIDYKSFSIQTLVTNITSVLILSTDSPPVLLQSNQVLNAQNGGNSIKYLPFSFGWSGSRPDARGMTSFALNESVFLPELSSSDQRIQALAGAHQAGGNFTILNLNLSREQKLPADWSILAQANGQWANEPLISNEQFALGGVGGVRGYQDGANYGDTGWRVLCDLRAPPVNVGYFPTEHGGVSAYLRGSWFMDYGESYLLDRPGLSTDRIQQWGTGVGFYYTAGEHFDARLMLAWALHNTPSTRVGDARVYFSIGIQF